MKARKFLAIMTMAALSLTLLAPIALADEAIIGGIAPLTGPVSAYGLKVRAGVDLCVKEINEAGGLLGQQIVMDWRDDTHDAVEAVNAYNQLAGAGVKAVIGAVTTTPTLAVVPLSAADNMPQITASATAYAVTDAGSNMFRACFLDPYQAENMAVYAAEGLGAKTVAVLYDNTNDYSIGLYESFVKRAEALGLTVGAVEAAVEGDADYTPQLIKIADAEPDAVFVCYYYETAALVLRQAVDVGLDAYMMGADGWSGIEEQVQDDLSLLDKAVFSDQFTPSDESEVVQAFVASFSAEYGETPSMFNALGYDAAKILFSAIERAGSLDDRDAIIAEMKATDAAFTTGHITYDDHNDPIKSVLVMGFENGKQVLKSRIDP